MMIHSFEFKNIALKEKQDELLQERSQDDWDF